MADETKVCSKCGETKPLTEFYKDAGSKDGYRGECKACRAEYQRQYLADNAEVIRERKRQYHAGNAEAINEKARQYRAGNAEVINERRRQYYADNTEALAEYDRQRNLRRKYGITLADYDAILEAQGNACAICGKAPEENGQRLAVDHDHATGEVRGLLCRSCNVGLGYFQDSATLTAAATLYLEVNR